MNEQTINQTIASLKQNPNSAEALAKLGTIYCSRQQSQEALDCFRRAVAINPNVAQYHYQLGFVLHYCQQFDEALHHYQKVLSLTPNHPNTLFHIGHIFRQRRQLAQACKFYQHALTYSPNNKEYFCTYAVICNELCYWDQRDSLSTKLKQMIQTGLSHNQKSTLGPFESLAFPFSAEFKHQIAQSHSQSIADSIAPLQQHCHFNFDNRSHDKCRIGYVSSDFYEHATSQLLWGLLEDHDRENFNIYAYSHGPQKDDRYRQHVVNHVDEFIDIEKLDYLATAKQIYQDEIDILVDLKGFTQGSRLGVFALHPAPVQITFLGYPDSTGADFIDYILTDRIVSPPNKQHLYSEKLLYCPDSYQPNHQHHEAMDHALSREACGLPESAFVYCCFNNSYKIEPEIFGAWMSILKQTTNTVLWIYQSSPDIVPHLLAETKKSGVDPKRLFFAPSRPKGEHLARHQLADLFLDTTIINAHTTASDALWAGLPVLTCRGESFSQRVAASLLTAVGLKDFITANLADYQQKAIYFANHPDKLQERRKFLQQNRLNAPLFDSPKYTRNLEALYQSIWLKGL